MNKLYKFLITWIFTIIWLSSFCSAWNISFTWHFEWEIGGYRKFFQLPVPLKEYKKYWFSINCEISNYSWASNYEVTYFANTLNDQFSDSNYNWWNFNIKNWNFSSNANLTWQIWNSVYLRIWQSSNWPISFDWNCNITWDNIVEIWWACDYSDYENTINILTWNLATCQSDLTNCQNSNTWTWNCSVYNKIQENIIFSWSKSFSNAWYTNMFNYWDYGSWTYCLKFTSDNAQTLTMWFANWWTTAPTNLYSLYNDQYWNRICLYWNKPYLNVKLNSSSNTISYEIYKLTDLLSSSIPCDNSNSSCDTWTILSGYILESSINSEYCINNNLCYSCPTIDAQYCMNNFNLIPPAYCPICWTWDINWSSLYINWIQYNWNEIIDIHTEDQMETNVDFLNDTVDIDITYGQDEQYLDNVIAYTQMTPTNEDLATLLSDWLETYAPYLFIWLLLIFTIAIIKKFFR